MIKQEAIIIKKQAVNPGARRGNPGGRLLEVKVHPGAGRTAITGFSGGVLQIKIAAPPEKGQANRELSELLSRMLGVNRSAVSIVKGETGRHKLIAVEGMSLPDIIKRLSA